MRKARDRNNEKNTNENYCHGGAGDNLRFADCRNYGYIGDQIFHDFRA